MPTAEELAFLQRIRENPADDGPRLIYADWLDEQGDARGEFIRLQCALETLPADDPHRPELQDRERNLLEAHEARWTNYFHNLATGWEFHRGLIESILVDAATFVKRGADLFKLAPIRRVRFSDATECFPALMDTPLLAQVHEIDLSGAELGNGGPNVLARSPYLTSLEVLHLGFNALTDRGLEALAAIPALSQLKELHLNDNPQLGTPGIRALADSVHLRELRTLDISGNGLTGPALRLLINSKTLTKLDSLILPGNAFGDGGIESLAKSALLTRMLARSSKLELCNNNIGPVAVRALAESPLIEPVEVLDLSNNTLGDNGFAALARSPYLSRVRSLILRDCGIGDPGLRTLAQSRMLETLQVLDLHQNFVATDSVRIVDEATTALDWRKKIDIRTDAGLHLRGGARVRGVNG
jgi:uncharacterized protein (TIGR02996 family)